MYVRLERMLRSLEHRGPDDWGMYFETSGRSPLDAVHVQQRLCLDTELALGHRRLSILDLSERGRQPMTSTDGRLTIVFNGEIYNYVELRSALAMDTQFRTGTDTEVLLEGYRRWGREVLDRVDGMFAFAIWDAETRKLFCARDPLGIKPFYFAESGRFFMFASEPRAILEGLMTAGHVDRHRVAEFLVLGLADYDDGTSYEEVRQLRGGEWALVDAGGRIERQGSYWHPPETVLDGREDLASLVHGRLRESVGRQLRSDVPVGCCLSGGLDSGAIVSLAAPIVREGGARLQTLTFTSPGFKRDEGAAASRVAAATGADWHSVQSDMAELSADLETMARRMDEPFIGLSVLAQYKIMEQARALGLKVMLDGQGGDEVFLGYARVAQRSLMDYARAGRYSAGVREWFALARNSSQPLLFSLLGNAFFSSAGLAVWRNRRRLETVVDAELLHEVRDSVAADRFRSQDTQCLQRAELTRYVLPTLLRYEDRSSMAFGIEARVPLLGVEVLDVALRLPLEWQVRNGWTKYALRLAVESTLPGDIVWQRRKVGFEVPQGAWLAAVRPQVETWIRECATQHLVKSEPLIKRLRFGEGDSVCLWRCISVLLWLRFSGVQS